MKHKKAVRFLILSAILLLVGCGEKVTGTKEQKASDEKTPETPYVITLANYETQPKTDFSLYKKEPDIKAIYVSSSRAGVSKYLDPLIELTKQTEINAMVIDVKTDDGIITFEGIPAADELGLSSAHIKDVKELMSILYQNDIYPIARIVCFKDNAAVKSRPDLYIKNPDGTIWENKKYNWMNPYNKESWDYILDVAKGAANVGFKEIQFDYIRFDTTKKLENADFGDTQGKTKTQIISEFAKYAMDELKPYNVKVSADVYGTIINSDIDADIVGQDYTELSTILDVICPMLYPSHYSNGSMGIEFPDLAPYDTIYKALELSNERLAAIPEGEHRAIVRPWLQDFTATWVKPHMTYAGPERRAQIDATYAAGSKEWIFWDAGVNYDADGFMPKQ